MVDALRPGGWLLLEAVDFFPVHTSTSQLWADFVFVLTANVVRASGFDCFSGRARCRDLWREWAFGRSVAKATFLCCKDARRLPNCSLWQRRKCASELSNRESLVWTGWTGALGLLASWK
jgi:hypothetical protein